MANSSPPSTLNTLIQHFTLVVVYVIIGVLQPHIVQCKARKLLPQSFSKTGQKPSQKTNSSIVAITTSVGLNLEQEAERLSGKSLDARLLGARMHSYNS